MVSQECVDPSQKNHSPEWVAPCADVRRLDDLKEGDRVIRSSGQPSDLRWNPARRRRVLVSALLLAVVASAYLPTTGAKAAAPSLREQAERSGILIGSG